MSVLVLADNSLPSIASGALQEGSGVGVCVGVFIFVLNRNNFIFRRRKGLPMPETELKLVAAPAMIGLRAGSLGHAAEVRCEKQRGFAH